MLDVLFAAADADEQREIDAARWLARRMRQALTDLALYEVVEEVDAGAGCVTVRGTPRQMVGIVELLERAAEQHRRW